MASKYNYKKDFNNRIIYYNRKLIIVTKKALLRDKIIKVPKIQTSITKIRNRCLYTGSSRSVISKYKLGRFFLKKASRAGLLNGVRKSSW